MGVKKEIESILSSMICDDGTVSEQFKGTKLETCAIEQVENWLSVLKGNCIEEKQPLFYVERIGEIAKQAEYILDRMFQTGTRHITRNKLIHECRRIHSTGDFDRALSRLEEKKYVRTEKVATGGRPSIKIEFDETGLDAFYVARQLRKFYTMESPKTYKALMLNCNHINESRFKEALVFLSQRQFMVDINLTLESWRRYRADPHLIFCPKIFKEGALCN